MQGGDSYITDICPFKSTQTYNVGEPVAILLRSCWILCVDLVSNTLEEGKSHFINPNFDSKTIYCRHLIRFFQKLCLQYRYILKVDANSLSINFEFLVGVSELFFLVVVAFCATVAAFRCSDQRLLWSSCTTKVFSYNDQRISCFFSVFIVFD